VFGVALSAGFLSCCVVYVGLVYISAILPCLVAYTVGLYSSSDDVIELTQSNFNTRVIQSDQLWLVEFYAPW